MKNLFMKESLVAIVGAILLFLVSPYTWLIFMPDNFLANIYDKAMTHDIMPLSTLLYGGLFLWGSFSFFITSILFALLSLSSGKKSYIYFFVVFVSILMIMNFLWIIHNWSYGLKFQGEYYTIIVTIANGIFFILLYSLVFIFEKTKKNQWIHAANFLFCLMLIFLMFPWLGENI